MKIRPFSERLLVARLLFIILAILLTILPFLTTFNEFLTSLALRFHWYVAFQQLVIPIETRMIAAILSLFQFKVMASPTSIILTQMQSGIPRTVSVYLSWNCIGWQSLVLFLLTLYTGLSGNFSLYSKIHTVIFGFLGTLLINFIRITLVALVGFYTRSLWANIFHDYASTLMTIAWLFGFWWYAHTFILERKAIEEIEVNKPLKLSRRFGKNKSPMV